MADLLNFDDVAPKTIAIQKRGQRFDLREDVPARVLMRSLTMRPERYWVAPEGAADVTDEILTEWDAAMARYEADLTRLCADLFRHTLPEMTDAEIADLFTTDEMGQIIQLFFARRGMTSATPTAGSEPKPKRRSR